MKTSHVLSSSGLSFSFADAEVTKETFLLDWMRVNRLSAAEALRALSLFFKDQLHPDV